MRIEKLKLKNFRAFSHLEISFDEQQTVVVARNGQGKTAVLDGCAIALGTFVGAFDMGKARHIQPNDARYTRDTGQSDKEQQYPVEVEATITDLSGGSLEVKRELSGPKGRTTIGAASALTDLGRQLMAQVRSQQAVTLPVIGYYGTGRLWKTHKNTQRKAVLSESRALGYEDCLTSASSFIQLQQWMRKAAQAVIQAQERADPSAEQLAAQVFGIRRSVDRVLAPEGWQDMHYSLRLEELVMQHREQGLLPVGFLSDGVRAMVSMVADIAWRCTKLNPHLKNDAPRETSGIVMIDEVDLHLHPAWQQTIMGSLAQAFPKVQFIVTTHSPQVLTTVHRKCIRLLKAEWDLDERGWVTEASTPSTQTLGVASADTLARIMDIDPVPDVKPARELDEYRTLIEQGKDEEPYGRELCERLLAHFGSEHPEILECERLKRFRQFKQNVKDRAAVRDA